MPGSFSNTKGSREIRDSRRDRALVTFRMFVSPIAFVRIQWLSVLFFTTLLLACKRFLSAFVFSSDYG